MKQCCECKKTKPKNQFKSWNCGRGHTYVRYTSYCLDCAPIVKAKSLRQSQIKIRYGLSLFDYNKRLEEQFNSCEICKKDASEFTKPLYIDHNHKTGKVRGLLCAKCNTAVGTLENNNVELLYKYLAKYE